MKYKKGDNVIFDCPYEDNRVGVVTAPPDAEGRYEILSRKIWFMVKPEKIRPVPKIEENETE